MPAAIGLAIGSLLFTIGVPLAVVNFFAIGIGGQIAFAVITAAVLGAFGGRPTTPTIKPSDGQIVTSNPVAGRIKSYGRVRLAGVRFWLDAETVDGVMSDGRALNHGRIGGFVSYHIDDQVVTIDGSGDIQTAPYSSLGTAQILTRLGAASETAYAELETDFGYADVRGDGVASLLVRIDNFDTSEEQFENFPNGQPHIKVTIDSSVVWDLREAGQDREDETTWETSDNLFLCLLDYLKHREGHAIPWERFSPNLADYIVEADYCDEEVVSLAAGGFESRYRVGGTFLLTDPPKDVVARFMRACDGRVWQKRDGTIGIVTGRFTPPSVTLPNRDILSYDMVRGTDRLSAVAGIRAQYMSPNHDYREQDAEPWPDGETVMALSEDRVAALDLLWVPSHGQARRLMKRADKRATAAWTGTVRTNLAGLRAIDERYVTLQIDEIGIDRSFEVDKFTIDLARMECEFALTAVDASIDAFDTDEEGTAPAIPAGSGGGQYVAKAEGTTFGDMNHMSRAFDDDRDADANTGCAIAAGSSAYVGKTWASPKRFSSAVLYGSNDVGFKSNNNELTVNVRAKTGAEPANGADGTIVGTLTLTDTGDESGGRAIASSDVATEWDHWWLENPSIVSGGFFVGEIDWWEVI